jgi:predicted esterase
LCTGGALAAEIPKGRVLEKVACASDNAQTYALYIPTNYEPGRKWPVLFCFDPGARGKAPVERFQGAAEKFGWLVAGSNNSRNGPWEANAKAINAMFTDVNRYFPIDAKRIYVAGLSGGARVACQVALGGIAKGVIACSAGFPSEIPGKVPFPFFGTAGMTDFNYAELKRVDRELEDRRTAHRVVIFGGGHEWLPPELAVEALAWLELQAMRTGTREKDAGWIEEQFNARSAAVPGQPLPENFRGLKSLAADFKGLADTAALEKKVAALAASREVRDQLKAERANERREEELSGNLMLAIDEGMVGSVRKQVAELRKKSEATADEAERKRIDRVIYGVYSSCSTTARELMHTGEYADAEPLLECMTVLRPERSQGWFDLARVKGYLREKKNAIAALQQAVAAGFKDAERVRGEKAFEAWRSDPAFVAVVERMK